MLPSERVGDEYRARGHRRDTNAATASITPKALAIIYTANNKVYDGLVAATGTYADDRIAGDVLTTTGPAVFANKNAGTGKTVTAMP